MTQFEKLGFAAEVSFNSSGTYGFRKNGYFGIIAKFLI